MGAITHRFRSSSAPRVTGSKKSSVGSVAISTCNFFLPTLCERRASARAPFVILTGARGAKSIGSRAAARFIIYVILSCSGSDLGADWVHDMRMANRPIKSAERTIALFELFSATERPLSTGEVSKALLIPQSSTTMLLRNLCSIGYLDFDRATRLYKPTIRILLLSSWMTRRFSETGQIASALDALYERTREVVILSIQNNARMQTILMRGADRAGTQFDVPNDDGERHIRIRSGLFASLTCSAMGRAVLSLKSNREIRSWTRRANAEADSPRLRIPEREMLEVTDIVRQKGYAETQG